VYIYSIEQGQNITNITIAFPDWFWVVFSVFILGFVFFLGGLFTKLRAISTEFPKIKTALVRISEILLQKGLTKDFVFSESPVSLTQEGRDAVKQCGFDAFYQENKKLLIGRVNKKRTKSMAELELACKEVMTTMENEVPKFDLLENFAYQNGIPLAKILFACGIALRDILAKELKIAA